MIITALSFFLFLIFSALGGLHFYWAFGGKWGVQKVIPTKKNESNSLAIPTFATIIVGVALLSFGLLYLIKVEIIAVCIPNWFAELVYCFIPIIFLLRAIGEFKYVGFFKRFKNTSSQKRISSYSPFFAS